MPTSYKQISVPELGKDTPLYRYFCRKTFEKFIEDRELWFSKISSWDDKQEGLRTMAMRVKLPGHELANSPLCQFYGSCWSLQTEDDVKFEKEDHYRQSVKELANYGSDPMWRAYCRLGGVRIKTTLGKLEELLTEANLPTSNIYSGRVHYDPGRSNWSETLRSSEFVNAFLHKRVCFRYEAEFRFLFCANDEISDDHIKLPIRDLSDFVDEVLISPAIRGKCSEHRAHELKEKALTIYPMNAKNNQTFCRISQLWDRIGFHRN